MKLRPLLIVALVAIWVSAISERLIHKAAVTPHAPTEHVQRGDKQENQTHGYGEPVQLGLIQDTAINESSGLVASRANPGLFWTHNDSGDGPFVYALDRQGKSRGVWRVSGAEAHDWEDIAAGPGPLKNRSYLYIGDIGDNNSKRSEIEIYRVLEPTITHAASRSTKSTPQALGPAEVFHLRYPDKPHDAETLLVHPRSGDVYVITKEFLGRAEIYKAKAPLDKQHATNLVKIGELNIPSLLGGFVTGGDISPDGRRVAVCDYGSGYELVLAGDKAFDEIWKQPVNVLTLGRRKQGESIAYRLDGKGLLTTSEGTHSPLIEIVRP